MPFAPVENVYSHIPLSYWFATLFETVSLFFATDLAARSGKPVEEPSAALRWIPVKLYGDGADAQRDLPKA